MGSSDLSFLSDSSRQQLWEALQQAGFQVEPQAAQLQVRDDKGRRGVVQVDAANRFSVVDSERGTPLWAWRHPTSALKGLQAPLSLRSLREQASRVREMVVQGSKRALNASLDGAVIGMNFSAALTPMALLLRERLLASGAFQQRLQDDPQLLQRILKWVAASQAQFGVSPQLLLEAMVSACTSGDEKALMGALFAAGQALQQNNYLSERIKNCLLLTVAVEAEASLGAHLFHEWQANERGVVEDQKWMELVTAQWPLESREFGRALQRFMLLQESHLPLPEHFDAALQKRAAFQSSAMVNDLKIVMPYIRRLPKAEHVRFEGLMQRLLLNPDARFMVRILAGAIATDESQALVYLNAIEEITSHQAQKHWQVSAACFEEGVKMAKHLFPEGDPRARDPLVYFNLAYGIACLGTQAVEMMNQDFGVTYFLRYSPEMLRASAETTRKIRNGEPIGQPIALWAESGDDHNGANYAITNALSGQVPKGHALLLTEDTSDNRIWANIDQRLGASPLYLGSIGLLYVRGHASAASIEWGKSAEGVQEETNTQDVKALQKLRRFFNSQAYAVLHACEAGASDDNSPARVISRGLAIPTYATAYVMYASHLTGDPSQPVALYVKAREFYPNQSLAKITIGPGPVSVFDANGLYVRKYIRAVAKFGELVTTTKYDEQGKITSIVTGSPKAAFGM